MMLFLRKLLSGLVRADYRNTERCLPGRDIRLLFDMRMDPTERYSLAAHRPDKWRELETLLMRGQQEFAAGCQHHNAGFPRAGKHQHD